MITVEEYKYLDKKAETRGEAIARLDDIVHVLRIKCPWDREQDHKSLRKGMIEEAYEVVDAINKEDLANLREELGDVLLQVVFHAVLCDESDEFTLTDVINEECEKMIRRHPHVFLSEEAKTVDKVLEKWENIKVKEHHTTSYTERLKAVPDALPALLRSSKIQKRAAEAGFDWEDSRGAFEKLSEETEELIEAYNGSDSAAIEEELGDLLFSAVNVSRFLDVDPEEALRRAADKFVRRFEQVETLAERSGRHMSFMDLQELDALWDEVKNNE
ncbi:MAG: nucleoside triphosphate pyrophosphohydrolase [Anaerovoracaceae bacterium]|jgi:tetrapyrrole methylase family protein/MazG family protein